MDLTLLHPYVYFATRYPFSRGQQSLRRHCYSSSLYLISSGRGWLHTNGRAYHTVPGSLLYMPAGQPHDWIADTEDPMVHVCCYFDWSYVDRREVSKHPSPIAFDPSQLQQAYVGPAFPFPLAEFWSLDVVRVWQDMFEKFYTPNEYINERTYMRSLRVQSHFQAFTEYFLTFVLQAEHIPDPRMNKLLERLDQDLVRGSLQPLEAYYTELRISRGYFFALFKSATGLSPVQYINRFRINRTKDDLQLTTLSITEIADKHLFSSVHYFSKLFHQLVGMTPSEFRGMAKTP